MDPRLPRLRLATLPTPVAPLSPGLWVKRDDLTSALYGGNKVRKLERFLGVAVDRGKTRLLTVGAAGSHQVLATVIYGKNHGFTVEAVVVPQPFTISAERNLRTALALGLVATAAPAWALAPFAVAARRAAGGRATMFIPLGGSDVIGSMAYVDAARELAAQIAAGDLPEPDAVVVALGSGGTAAGLAVGFEAEGLGTRVIGVAVSRPASVLGAMAHRLARATAARVGLSTAAASRAAARITVDPRWLGRGYGHATPEGDAAAAAAATAGLRLDATYTAKAYACALATVHGPRRGVGRPVLFWHTLSAVVPPLADDAPELPPRLARLFRGRR